MRVKCFLAALAAVLSWVLFAGVAGTTPTQEEFDEIVDREMFKYMHGWDYADAVNYWRKRGVTDEMFGKAYVKIARRTMNEPVGYDNKCSKAIDGIVEFCSGEMLLTNLLFLAEHTTYDRDRAYAIIKLARNTKPAYFTAFAERLVASTNLDFHAAGALMSGLSESYEKIDPQNIVWKRRIIQTLRRHLEVGGKGSAIADHALVRHDKTYAKSEFRRKMAERMLDPQRSPLKGNEWIGRRRVEEELRRVLREGIKK